MSSSSFRSTFRQWWQPPRGVGERAPDRSVSFLELFYDLVYVAVIAQLSHALASHFSWVGLRDFAFLFGIVWLGWLNGTIYHDTHGNNDMRTRVFTFLQMFGVAGMAVFAHDALGETSLGFGIALGYFLLILAYLWWRTGVHDPSHRPLSTPYSSAYLLAGVLVLAASLAEPQMRVQYWAGSIAVLLLWPLYTNVVQRRDPRMREQLDLSFALTPAAVERFGLFTIIVLGEVVVGVVGGMAGHHHLTLSILATGGLGMLIAIGLWWVYFDFVSHQPPKDSPPVVLGWLYLHLPMNTAIAATGAAVLYAIEHVEEGLVSEFSWIFCSLVALALACVALLIHMVVIDENFAPIALSGSRTAGISVIIILALAPLGLPVIKLLALTAGLLLLPIFQAMRLWIRRSVHEETMVE